MYFLTPGCLTKPMVQIYTLSLLGGTVRPERAAKSMTEAAYTEVRRDILGCRLVPGEKIKINDISGHHSVSVQAVREALSRLTAEGLVIAEAQRGFRVMPVSRADLEDLTSTRIEIEVS